MTRLQLKVALSATWDNFWDAQYRWDDARTELRELINYKRMLLGLPQYRRCPSDVILPTVRSRIVILKTVLPILEKIRDRTQLLLPCAISTNDSRSA